jgi:hypothetical protein
VRHAGEASVQRQAKSPIATRSGAGPLTPSQGLGAPRFAVATDFRPEQLISALAGFDGIFIAPEAWQWSSLRPSRCRSEPIFEVPQWLARTPGSGFWARSCLRR